MPLVTDSESPSGAPAATTVWPTVSSLDFANVAGLRSLAPSTLITARSFDSEVPTTRAVAVVPLWKVTVMLPCLAGARDHVIVGQDVPVLVQHHAAADAAAASRLDGNRDQRRLDLGGSCRTLCRSVSDSAALPRW